MDKVKLLKEISKRIKPNFLLLSVVTTMVIISLSNIVFVMIDNLDKWDDTELIAMLVLAIFCLLVTFFIYVIWNNYIQNIVNG